MKVSVIGLGNVGSSVAFVLATSDFVQELVLVGRSRDSVLGDALDLSHGQLFVENPTKVIAGTVEQTAQSDVLVICASVPTPADMKDRSELAKGNVALMKQLLPPLVAVSPECKIVMVSNPVDVLVYYAIQFSGLPASRVFGTGTLVDSARFRHLLSEQINIHQDDIRAYILGEHGNSQFPALSCAHAGGEKLDPTPERYELSQQAASAGFQVLKLKGYTNYAIALATASLVRFLCLNQHHTVPISLLVDGYLGVSDVCLSLPAVVGRKGIERILHPQLNLREQKEFLHSASVVSEVIESCREI